MRKCIVTFILSFLLVSDGFAQIRKAISKEDGILTVKTALGIATIIQLPEVVQSAIIGDQSGFKIEYLDKAVTIKPLRWGAKTNLYLVTDSRRFNIRLTTGSQEIADYIVYLKKPEPPIPETKWKILNRSATQKNLKLSAVRVGASPEGFILIDVVLTSTSPQRLTIKPESVWIKQSGNSKVINSLFMSDSKVEKGKPLRLGISLAKSDLVAGKPVSIEIQSDQAISLQLAEVDLWK
ncbi:MAG: TrbG/VirB9 family P-type conjugative transfer protein [Bdellovibrionaceae bacterium]|nr:TrbG/VirB9 family P-type conjugative transfer protein [Pseudobdellovibrionaceae bacterium]